MAIARSAAKKTVNGADNRAFWGKFLILFAGLAVLAAFFTLPGR